MVIATDGPVIGLDAVPHEIQQGDAAEGAGEARTFQELKSDAERRIVISALERNGWNITQTAKSLGLADHASLLKIMRRHDIKRP
jgi:transcriptional regulator with GAF, ATPase, and Fis domain